MFYTIYKVTNIINGKYYIGKHQTKDLKDDYMGSGRLIRAAIKKYGADNFHKEILHVVQTEKEMDLLEKILVVPDQEINYNLCEGGKGGWSYINRLGINNAGDIKNRHEKIRKTLLGRSQGKKTEETKKKIGLSLLGNKNSVGYKHTLVSKKKISDANKKMIGPKNGSFGTCWITNGQVNKKIKKDELDNWLELGYYKGRI